ncbi:MAG: glycosyltransferase [Phycisphaera sp.]|nr:glycosyltransferase [Phycisphaera sp.]
MITRNRTPVIAHVLHRLYLAGAEVLAADLARRLGDPRNPASPYRFVFLCLDEIGPLGQKLADEGHTVIDLRRKPGVDLRVAKRIRRYQGRLGIDLYHAHQYTPFFYASLSRGVLGRPPILFTEHGRHYPDYRRPKRVIANKFLMRQHDRVTAVATWVKRALVDNEGIRPERIEVILNGIDPERFAVPSAALRQEVRRELDIAPDQPVILQVARFHPVKDHATALRAHAMVVRSIPGALLLLVGEGEERAHIERQALELGVRERVRFLGVRSDVPRIMAAADVFLLSSVSEGISVTLLEAMGCGLPIVATDVGGNGEVVENNVTGLLAPRGDHEGLGEHLVTLLRQPALRSRMGAAARQRLLDQFTQQRNHEAYAGIYAAMLDR